MCLSCRVPRDCSCSVSTNYNFDDISGIIRAFSLTISGYTSVYIYERSVDSIIIESTSFFISKI